MVNLPNRSEALDLAGEECPAADGEALLHPFTAEMEPLEADLASTVADDHFIQPPTVSSGNRLTGSQDFAAEDVPGAIAQVGDPVDLAPVLIAKRKRVKDVFDGGKSHPDQLFHELRANTPDLGQGGVEKFPTALIGGSQGHGTLAKRRISEGTGGSAE